MKANVEKEANNVVKINIEIPAKDAIEGYNKAVRRISEYVNIPGFRKGKAPRNMVEQHVGVERIKHETLDIILPEVLNKVIIDNKLDVISQPYIESYSFEVGEDLKVTAKAELRPEVKLGKYKDLTVEIEEHVIPDDAFDKSLNSLLEKNSTFNIVVDRPTKETDLIVMDFDGSVNGEKIKGGAAQNYPLDLAHSTFIPGFAEKLVGKKLNEDFDITVNFPKDYHEKTLAGQPAVFKIKIREIKEKVLPTLTDEFAKKVGPFKTVEDLRADIQKFLDVTKEQEDRRNSDNAIFEKVLSEAKIDIQDSMIEREKESLLEEYKQRLAMQGINWDELSKNQNQDGLLAELRQEAEARIKNSLVIDKIAQEENIKIDSKDLDKKLEEIAAAYQVGRAEIIKQLKQNPAIFTSLSQQALNEKVVKFLADNNKVQFKKGTKTTK